jgi:glycosyltransferase involved in cell wall biosynthesis
MASLEVLPNSINKKIIVCLDHCTDSTKQILKDFQGEIKTKIDFSFIENNGPQGKSNALNSIFLKNNKGVFCVVDDDVELNEECFLNLINTLINKDELRCVFASWVRKEFKSKNLRQKFWHWILGVKFDIDLFDEKSKYMRGACMLFRAEDYVYMSPRIINEDQFLQYIYWPYTKEVDNAVVYFHSVASLTDYYKRFVRIKGGSNQLNNEFYTDRVKECHKGLHYKINYKNVWKSPWKLKLPFMIYRFLRFFVNIMVNLRLKLKKDYEWHRIKQG